jgi:3-oxoacyl-[acyl-carrier protein] reductase
MFDLTGKTALVTGASGGIGADIARALHAGGGDVGLSGTRTEPLEALAAELGEPGACAALQPVRPGAVEGLVKRATEAMGSVDILVNNAGITKDGLAMRMSDEDWQSVIDVNLTATFRLCRAAIRGMMKARWGRIVNISSVVGTDRQRGAGELCGLQGRDGRPVEIAGRGSGQPGHHGELRRPRIHRNRDDRQAERRSEGGILTGPGGPDGQPAGNRCSRAVSCLAGSRLCHRGHAACERRHVDGLILRRKSG